MKERAVFIFNGSRTKPALRKKGVYYGWIIVALSFLISLITSGLQYSFGVFLTPLQEQFGWSRAAISWAPGVLMLMNMGIAPFSGWFTDRHGPKIPAILGGLLIGLGLVLTSRVETPWQLYIFYGLLVGGGMGCITIPLIATISRWFMQRRGLALGIYFCGGALGIVILPPLLRYIISAYSWRTAFLVIGIAAWAIVVSAAFFLKKQSEERTSSHEEVTAEEKGDAAPESTEITARQAVRTSTFWSIFLLYTLWSLGAMMISVHVVAYAEDVGIAKMTAATILSVIGGVGILGRLVMGTASDRLGRKPTLIFCFLLQALAMLWLTQANSIGAFYLFAAIYGTTSGGLAPAITAWLGELFGLLNVGAIMGLLATEFGLGAAIGPPIAGYVADTTGSYSIAFLGGGLLMLLSATVVLFLKKPRMSS